MILHVVDKGEGKPVVLLHGMAASLRYWDTYVNELAKTRRVIALDLLGFGRSPKPRGDYTPEAHVAAVRDTLQSLGLTQPMTLVGHSMGALIALKYAVAYPGEVAKLTLISLPIYINEVEAKQDVTQSKLLWRLVYYGPGSHLLCATWCSLLRPLSRRVAPLYLPMWPKAVAEDSVLHTWRSFSESLHHVVEVQDVSADLQKLPMPNALVYGDKEKAIILRNVRSLGSLPKQSKLVWLDGTHNLPLEQQEKLLQLI